MMALLDADICPCQLQRCHEDALAVMATAKDARAVVGRNVATIAKMVSGRAFMLTEPVMTGLVRMMLPSLFMELTLVLELLLTLVLVLSSQSSLSIPVMATSDFFSSVIAVPSVGLFSPTMEIGDISFAWSTIAAMALSPFGVGASSL